MKKSIYFNVFYIFKNKINDKKITCNKLIISSRDSLIRSRSAASTTNTIASRAGKYVFHTRLAKKYK